MRRHYDLRSGLPGSRERDRPDAPPGIAAFDTTHWSLVLATRETDVSAALTAMEALCRHYWFPVYAFIRHHGHRPEDAEDLTQMFFAHLLTSHFLTLADPGRGRFRGFLIASLRHFLANHWDRTHSRKRGGEVRVVSMEDLPSWERRLAGLSPAEPPDRVYDRVWAQTVLDRVSQRLREEYTASGKGDRVGWLESLLTGHDQEATYGDLGHRYGLSVGAVKSEVHRFRARFRVLLRRELAHTVACPEEIDEELRDLLAVFTS